MHHRHGKNPNRKPEYLRSIEAYDREVNRRIFQRRLEVACEIVGTIICVAMFVGLIWLYVVATPPQRSAEADLAAEQMEGGAK